MRIWWREKWVTLGAIIVFVASLSFGFGYLANREMTHAPIIIEACGAGH
jgi:hypothetical protein